MKGKTMTNDDKRLLLKDLCERVPYNTICYIKHIDKGDTEINTLTLGVLSGLMFGSLEVKPYLRSMSSMTDKEMKEYSKYAFFGNILGEWVKSIDWLNAHHFDYRDLIKGGLALEATADMYKAK